MAIDTETVLNVHDAIFHSSHNDQEGHLANAVVDLIAGTAAGIANVYAGQPLDTVKVKLQTFPHLYANSRKCFFDCLKSDGVRGLYAGTVPALVANVAENAALFTAYGYCQKGVALLRNQADVLKLSPIENATAGGLAAFFAAVVLCPTELVKCRLQAANELTRPFGTCKQTKTPNAIDCILSEFLSKVVCAVAFWPFMITISCLMRTAVSGSVGGISLWIAIYPFDMVKSRMQVRSGGSLLSNLNQIVRSEGPTALYRGLTPTLIRTCLASSALFITYEYTKRVLQFASN